MASKKWGPVSSSPALLTGTYTAVAEEASSLGNATGKSSTVTFVVNTEPPVVTVEAPPARSKESKPTFKGTASEAGQVTVHVYKGSKAEGEEAAKLSATVSEGKWSVGVASTLPDGIYTVQATEPSAIGNGPGASTADTFEIFTKPPTVTMEAPATRSKENKPTFKGTASEPGQVTVRVFKGKEAKGTEAANLKATVGAKGEWSVAPASALPDETYTAVAIEPSAIGNADGESKPPRTFEVFTQAPTVTITHGPEERSKQTKPSFEGEASETEAVTVHIYEGSGTSGKEATSLTATVSEHKWHVTATAALVDGKYTAQATEPSSIGNPQGASAQDVFEVFTKPPTVTMETLAPRSNENKPTFKGSASEPGQVTVRVFKGKEAKGTEAANLKATVGPKGEWSVSPAAVLPDETYTAVAFEPSAIGNLEGASEPPRTFEIFTKPPTVKITHGPEPRSNKNKPLFEGEASETEPVTVHIFKGAGTSGGEITSFTASVSEHKWKVTAGVALPDGEYTAVATEPSSIGNGPGEGGWPSFKIYTKAPALECHGLPLKSSENMPAFSGASNEPGVVTVRVYKEAKKPENEEATLVAHVEGGKWATGHVAAELEEGPYIAVAEQASDLLGNPPGSCEVPFEVNTGSPFVSLDPLAARSNVTTPSFSGLSSEKGHVKVVVFEGPTPEGKIVATVEANVTGSSCSLKSLCKWSTGPIPALFTGQAAHVYTAVAEQVGEISKVEGVSEPQSFEIDTTPPRVTLTALPQESNVSRPAFSGTASDPSEEVTVHVYKGAEPKGELVATVKAHVSGGPWTAAALASALTDGEYTAIAAQPSSIKNPPGESAPMTFKINTLPPLVTLKKIPSPTGDTAPSFSGTATDPQEKVTVHVYSGPSASGQQVAAIEAEVSGGQWTSPSLVAVGASLEDGEYTAVAVQPSSLKNAPGQSVPIHFTVEVQPPTVSEVTASASRTAALMNATVDANGGRLSVCRFEYGTTTEYGKEAQCAFVIGAVSETNPGCAFAYPPAKPECEFPLDRGVPMFARTNRVTPGTTYFFRIVVENQHGDGSQAVGEGEFTTAAREAEETPPPPPPTGKGGTTPIPSNAVLGAMIAKELAPTGKGATIAKLLKTGGYKAVFKLPAAGTAVIGWYYLPKGASLSKASRKKPKPVLVAAGKVTVSAASGATIKMGLTPAGRRLLKRAAKLKLTAKCTFTAAGKTTPIVTLKSFTLKR